MKIRSPSETGSSPPGRVSALFLSNIVWLWQKRFLWDAPQWSFFPRFRVSWPCEAGPKDMQKKRISKVDLMPKMEQKIMQDIWLCLHGRLRDLCLVTQGLLLILLFPLISYLLLSLLISSYPLLSPFISSYSLLSPLIPSYLLRE